jgi:putative alpha-1,2-mannosidase
VTENFNTTSTGLPGNDDSGAMSSWLAFQMMGFYPNAGQSYYLLNSPMLKQVILHQENGRNFTITAKNLSATNMYIKAAKLNGKELNQAWIQHADIVGGGQLVFEMTDKPTNWGTQILPPSNN